VSRRELSALPVLSYGELSLRVVSSETECLGDLLVVRILAIVGALFVAVLLESSAGRDAGIPVTL